MLKGLVQGVIACWNEGGCISLRVLQHRGGPGDLVSINSTFQKDVDVLLADF